MEAKGKAAGVLANLSVGDGLEQAIAAVRAALVRLLRDSVCGDEEEEHDGRQAIAERRAKKGGRVPWGASANSNDGKQAIAKAGAIPLLVQLLRDGSAEAEPNDTDDDTERMQEVEHDGSI
ncbi:hypothetical protein CYMTET_51222 [Cymbomonas tetramitiformis]|uniref:Uncharacterized protein n=1 Tax=Cymbomonas tetramitiformis TaxID=36881 RepID=A0AAE0BLQ9_9CHLO|nr:hypothetical protein CYMTET_51222 [Cymbomonas tetramitiformis]